MTFLWNRVIFFMKYLVIAAWKRLKLTKIPTLTIWRACLILWYYTQKCFLITIHWIKYTIILASIWICSYYELEIMYSWDLEEDNNWIIEWEIRLDVWAVCVSRNDLIGWPSITHHDCSPYDLILYFSFNSIIILKNVYDPNFQIRNFVTKQIFDLKNYIQTYLKQKL